MTDGWDEMFSRVKVAAVNFVPWKWHRDWNAERMEEFLVAAVEAGAELVVEPEGILEGYVANEAIAHPELREEMLAIAEPIEGPYVKRFRKLARQLKVCFVFGMAERVGRRDVHNTAVFLDHRGQIRGRYHKARLAEGYDPAWHFNRIGNSIRAFDTPLGRCGMLICNDRWEPLIPRALVLDGAQFLCLLTYGSTGKGQDVAVLARARENGVPIVQANVGRNLIISKGEVVALDPAKGVISLAEIDIPAAPSTRNARATERQYLAERPALMRKNLAGTRKKLSESGKDPYTPSPKPRRLSPKVREHTAESVNDR